MRQLCPEYAAMGPPARILVIDDSDAIRNTLRLTLEFKGYEVAEARDGKEGLAMIQESDYDLVFCDLGMPGLDGIGLIEAVRRNPQRRSLPIIVLSAEEREAKRRALEAGANASIDKPFSPRQVLHALEGMLRPRVERPQAGQA